MLLFHGWLFVLLHAAASEPVLPRQEVWEAVYRDTIRIGYVHTIVETLESKDIRASSDLNLTFRRASALVGVRMVHGTEDSPAGKVIRVFMRQYQGDKTSVQLNLNGNLTDDGRMRIDIDSGRVSRILPWSDDVLSLQRREAEFASRKPKPGDHWTQLVYEPIVNTLVTYQVTVREPEEVSSPGPRQTLLRVELKPDPLPHRQGNGTGKLQLPFSDCLARRPVCAGPAANRVGRSRAIDLVAYHPGSCDCSAQPERPDARHQHAVAHPAAAENRSALQDADCCVQDHVAG